jgi:hypothetical protein
MTELKSQVQSIVDNAVDRMHLLVDAEQVDNAKCLYQEFMEWLDESTPEHDVLSVDIEE